MAQGTSDHVCALASLYLVLDTECDRALHCDEAACGLRRLNAQLPDALRLRELEMQVRAKRLSHGSLTARWTVISDASPAALRRLSDGSLTALWRLSGGSLAAIWRLSDGSPAALWRLSFGLSEGSLTAL
jgi:hypothetical protein